MIFLRTHEVYRYCTYPFWDFSKYDSNPIISSYKINKTINQGQKITEQLDAIDTKDSVLLFELKGEAQSESKDSYLRLLITDGDTYIDQQTLLLSRKIAIDGRQYPIRFQFPIYSKMLNPNIRIGLENSGFGTSGSIIIKEIQFKRIKL
ncbi:MAG: hypothetical protein IT245_09330 [Bacteroidia bacterium]|nr:hypothetical protein [Bacteroidia bacterium]